MFCGLNSFLRLFLNFVVNQLLHCGKTSEMLCKMFKMYVIRVSRKMEKFSLGRYKTGPWPLAVIGVVFCVTSATRVRVRKRRRERELSPMTTIIFLSAALKYSSHRNNK